MPTFGFVIDNRKCIGCHACTVACKSEHQVPVGVDRTWVKYIEKGTFPNNRRLFTVMRCNHCEHAPCVTICPVTALHKRDDGVVDFNSDRCIGCKACMQACPYDALYIDPNTQHGGQVQFLHAPSGNRPAAELRGGLSRSKRSSPATWTIRPAISRLLDQHPVQVRKPEKGTRPKLFYIEATKLRSCRRGPRPMGGACGAAGPLSTPMAIPEATVAPPGERRRGTRCRCRVVACGSRRRGGSMTCVPAHRRGAGKSSPTPGRNRSPPARSWRWSRLGLLTGAAAAASDLGWHGNCGAGVSDSDGRLAGRGPEAAPAFPVRAAAAAVEILAGTRSLWTDGLWGMS